LLVTVPLMAPVPVAWISLGFDLNDGLANELKELTGAEVSIGRLEGDRFVVYASTLPPDWRGELGQQPARGGWSRGAVSDVTLGGAPYITLLSPLGEFTGSPLEVVLQRPLDEVMASYGQLRLFLGLLISAGLMISAVGAGLIARGVTLPIRRVVEALEKVAGGDYSVTVGVRRADEIGQLATAVDGMTTGLMERDRARELLGKMVSQQVATELLGRRLELGGEERVVTVLFADIRGFTRMSQNMPPGELVSVLNSYLTALSNVVEKHSGIVDKYIGDAIMAVFGAPIPQPDHAVRAVRAALAMHRSLDDLKKALVERGRPRVEFGIGINTAAVVVGNMGSARRVNYTVIGEGVNLAARVEKLTREYDVPIIVTQST
jgi:adenylate cyclase